MAKNKTQDYIKQLSGLKRLVLIADNDDVGRRYMQAAEVMHDKVGELKLVTSLPGITKSR